MGRGEKGKNGSPTTHLDHHGGDRAPQVFFLGGSGKRRSRGRLRSNKRSTTSGRKELNTADGRFGANTPWVTVRSTGLLIVVCTKIVNIKVTKLLLN